MTRLSSRAMGLALAASLPGATRYTGREFKSGLRMPTDPGFRDAFNRTRPRLANCTSDKEITPQCWADLEVPTYIDNWMKENGTAAGCDALGFAQCFLLAHGYSGLTCDDINSNTCPPFATVDPGVYASPQEFYVLWNIYNVYQIFNAWSVALFNGHQLAAGTIDDIVATVSPPTDAPVTHSIITSILCSTLYLVSNFMFPFQFAVPELVGEKFIAGLVVNNAATSFGLTSTMYNFMAGGGHPDVRFVTLAKVGSELTNLLIEFQQALTGGIREIQGNATLFLAMAQHGALSARLHSGNIELTVNLFHDLEVFILSSAMAANGIVSAKSTGVNARLLAPTLPGTVDCPGLGPAGNCHQYWVDEARNNTYSIHNPSDWGRRYVDVIDKVHDHGWADMAELLPIEACQGKMPELDRTTLSMTCLASHRLCEWNYPPVDPVRPGAYYRQLRESAQWLNCPNDKRWGKACSSFSCAYEIPPSYLGPALRWREEDDYWCPFSGGK